GAIDINSFVRHSYCHLRYLRSFPTRRSSDLLCLLMASTSHPTETLQRLMRLGELEPGARLISNHKGRRYEARIRSDGRVEVTKRSEEHTSELQSPDHLVCRLLLENKKD